MFHLLNVLLAVAGIGLHAESPGELAAFIDGEFSKAWRAERLTPSRSATDSEYLRRVWLDIAGVIPPEERVTQFLESKSRTKRSDMVESLLSSERYGEYSAMTWANTLVGRGTGVQVLAQLPFRSWLKKEFVKGTSFDAIVRAVITANGTPRENPATGWIIHHKGVAEDLTGAATRIFLGTQIQCAQCHNHPFEKWKQEDFYGMAAFFSRVKSERRFLSQTVSELPSGEVRLGGKADGKFMNPKFITGESPSNSYGFRRQQFADWLVSPKNKQFARAVSNRMWGRFFGRGIVEPIDDFGANNPPILPAVLERLAGGFAASGYDLKFLIRTIVRTRAYEQSSRPSPDNKDDEEYFSKARLRQLSPEQLLTSVVMSNGIGSNKRIVDNPIFKILMTGVLQQFVFVFSNMDEVTEVSEFQGTISQALLMMNSKPMSKVSDWKFTDPLARKMRAIDGLNDQIAYLFRSTLSRNPSRSELASFARHFEGIDRRSDRVEILEDVYWALINSGEFAFNH